jgi:non-heme chloroperoxidase
MKRFNHRDLCARIKMSSQIDEKMPSTSRRNVLMAGAGAAATATFSTLSHAAGISSNKGAGNHLAHSGAHSMSYVTTRDGTQIFYKDWGSGRPVVFSHGWPLDADAWDPQMLFLVQKGYRVIAHDRRGHGRSSQSGRGNDMDTYADDLAAVIEALDLKEMTLVGQSTGAERFRTTLADMEASALLRWC